MDATTGEGSGNRGLRQGSWVGIFLEGGLGTANAQGSLVVSEHPRTRKMEPDGHEHVCAA